MKIEEIKEVIEINNKIIADRNRLLKKNPVFPDSIIKEINKLHKENIWLKTELKKMEEK